MCFGGETYSEFLKHASNPRAKRQANLLEVVECIGFLDEVECTSGFQLGVANTFAQCGHNDMATMVANRCASNEMGELCATKVIGSTDIFSSAITSCQSEVAPGSTTCSTACSTALEMVRIDVGCCINSVLNATVGGIEDAFATLTSLFSSSLWDRCSVQTVGECANAPSFTPGSRDPPCTDIEAVQAEATYQCTQTNIQPVLDALNRNSICQFLTTMFVDACGQLSNGDLCLVDVSRNLATVRNLLVAVITNCGSFLTTQSCPGSSCTTAIEQFRDNSGCCVNNIHNSSITAASPGAALPTSIALWNACGVSSPGFCPSTLVGGSASTDSTTEVGGSASTDKAFGVMLIAIAAAVVKFIF